MMCEIKKEGAVAGAIDELQRFISQPVGQVFALASPFEVRDIASLGVEPASVREEIGGGGAPQCSADVRVETVHFGITLGVSKMPLADEAGLVAGRLQNFGNRDFLSRQIADGRRRRQLLIGLR